MRNLGWKRFSAVPESNNSHITTGNDTTSTQLLGIRPTLISYICVVTLKNKQQQKKKQYDWWNVTSGPAFCLVYWCRLSHDFCSYFKSHPREIKLLNLWNLFVCIQSRKCLLNPHRAFLSACPPTLFLSSSPCTCVSFSSGWPSLMVSVSQDWVIDSSSGRLEDEQPAHWCAAGTALCDELLAF